MKEQNNNPIDKASRKTKPIILLLAVFIILVLGLVIAFLPRAIWKTMDRTDNGNRQIDDYPRARFTDYMERIVNTEYNNSKSDTDAIRNITPLVFEQQFIEIDDRRGLHSVLLNYVSDRSNMNENDLNYAITFVLDDFWHKKTTAP